MFAAVRSKIIGAWKDLHARGLPSLFLFELVVVTLGVLLAQGLADVAADRRKAKEADAVVARLDLHARDIHDGARVWKAALPCLRDKVEEVMRRAASGDPVDPSLATRPVFWTVSPATISSDDWDLVREHRGNELFTDYRELSETSNIFYADMMAVATRWEAFARLDPALGQPSAADRDAVRDAAADIRSRMRGMGNDIDDMFVRAGRLKLEDREIVERGNDKVRPVVSCDEIDRYSKTFAPVEAY